MSRPLLTFYAKVRARHELRSKGYSFSEINTAMGQIDDHALEAAAIMAGPETEGAVHALGDGKLIDAILAFLKSDAGKALIDALTKMLIALITGL